MTLGVSDYDGLQTEFTIAATQYLRPLIYNPLEVLPNQRSLLSNFIVRIRICGCPFVCLSDISDRSNYRTIFAAVSFAWRSAFSGADRLPFPITWPSREILHPLWLPPVRSTDLVPSSTKQATSPHRRRDGRFIASQHSAVGGVFPATQDVSIFIEDASAMGADIRFCCSSSYPVHTLLSRGVSDYYCDLATINNTSFKSSRLPVEQRAAGSREHRSASVCFQFQLRFTSKKTTESSRCRCRYSA